MLFDGDPVRVSPCHCWRSVGHGRPVDTVPLSAAVGRFGRSPVVCPSVCRAVAVPVAPVVGGFGSSRRSVQTVGGGGSCRLSCRVAVVVRCPSFGRWSVGRSCRAGSTLVNLSGGLSSPVGSVALAALRGGSRRGAPVRFGRFVVNFRPSN